MFLPPFLAAAGNARLFPRGFPTSEPPPKNVKASGGGEVLNHVTGSLKSGRRRRFPAWDSRTPEVRSRAVRAFFSASCSFSRRRSFRWSSLGGLRVCEWPPSFPKGGKFPSCPTSPPILLLQCLTGAQGGPPLLTPECPADK